MKLRVSQKLGLAFALLICLYGILLSFFAYRYLATKIVDDRAQKNYDTVKNVHDYHLKRRLEDIEKALLCWSADPRLTSELNLTTPQNESLKALNLEWKNYMQIYHAINSIYFGSASDGFLNGYPDAKSMPPNYDGRERQWYQDGFNHPSDVIWSSPYFDIGNKDTIVMTLSKAVLRENRIIGVMGIDFKLSALSQMLRDTNQNNQGALVLLDKDQHMIAHSNPICMAHNPPNDPLIPLILGTHSIQGKLRFGNQDYVYTCESIPTLGWTLIGFQIINTSELFKNLMLLVLVTILMVTFVLLHAGVFSSRIIVKPLNTLMNTIEAIGVGGQPVRSNLKTLDEVGEIGRALDQMLDQLDKANGERVQTINQMHAGYVATVRSLANAIEAKDPYTRGHCDRVSGYALSLAKRLEFSEEAIRDLEFASILHDIGKVGIPDGIIGKANRLTEDEFAHIKVHPVIGSAILDGVHFLENSRQILLQHHERIDGKGYPNNLSDSEILPCAKILAIADSFDAMTSSRPYREAPFSTKEALYEIEKYKGTQFDTNLANHFISMMTTALTECCDERTEKCTS